MAIYTTHTSDKLRKKALILLACGGIGLHLFYVGKIKAGIIRFVLGLFAWVLIFHGTSDSVFGGVAVLIIFNIVDLVKLLLGTFQDNVGEYLRQ